MAWEDGTLAHESLCISTLSPPPPPPSPSPSLPGPAPSGLPPLTAACPPLNSAHAQVWTSGYLSHATPCPVISLPPAALYPISPSSPPTPPLVVPPQPPLTAQTQTHPGATPERLAVFYYNLLSLLVKTIKTKRTLSIKENVSKMIYMQYNI